MEKNTRYWFPAKRYGWGWGPPTVWQGWVALLASFLIMGWAVLRMLPLHPVRFLLTTLITVAVLILVCLLKGEPPSWRWGDDR